MDRRPGGSIHSPCSGPSSPHQALNYAMIAHDPELASEHKWKAPSKDLRSIKTSLPS